MQAQDDEYYEDEFEVEGDDGGGRQSSDMLGKRGREGAERAAVPRQTQKNSNSYAVVPVSEGRHDSEIGR